MSPTYLSPCEAARTMGVSTKTILRAIKARELRAIHLSLRTLRIAPADLETWAAARENMPRVLSCPQLSSSDS